MKRITKTTNPAASRKKGGGKSKGEQSVGKGTPKKTATRRSVTPVGSKRSSATHAPFLPKSKSEPGKTVSGTRKKNISAKKRAAKAAKASTLAGVAAMGGAKLGTLLGGPGLGTAVGAAIGGGIGWLIGQFDSSS